RSSRKRSRTQRDGRRPSTGVTRAAATDEALVSAIETAELTQVTVSDLPAAISVSLVEDYQASTPDEAFLAKDLGYMVMMREPLMDRFAVFYANNGRRLAPRRNGPSRDVREKCFELVYPMSLTMPDSTLLTGQDENTLKAAIDAWYAANPTATGNVTLNYPLDVSLADGSILSVADEAALLVLRADCAGTQEREACMTLRYPVSYTMPDGYVISVADEAAEKFAFETWYRDNPNVEERPSLMYPVDIRLKDGSTQKVDDETEMETAKRNCG
ncbi:MAG: hypothetical protein AAF399_30090, partial [Bacteroidota bacterium]